MFGPPGLDSALYSTSDCKALFSAFQVYFQHFIQQPSKEDYIRLSRAIFSTLFKFRISKLIFDPPGLYSALYSNSICRALYSALYVYIIFIQHLNVELYIKSSRSIFSTIFNNLLQSSIFGSIGLYSAQYLTPNAELYTRLYRSISSTILNKRI